MIDFVNAKKRARNDVHICFDEWNVWYHRLEEDSRRWRTWDWPEAPELLEEDYTFEDALFVGGLLNEFIRRSDRVKIACIAQLVNVIAPIRADKGGKAWRQSIYWPYQLASLYGRGTALRVAVDGPKYDCAVASDVDYLDIAAVQADGFVTIFAINRHLTEAMDLRLSLTGFDPRLHFHKVIEGHDLMATNGPDNEVIAPHEGSGIGVQDGELRGKLAPLSYHAIRLKV